MIVDSGRTRVAGSRSVLVAALLVAAAGGLLVRVVSVVEPLGIDQSLWASAVRGMSRGQLLYQDVWEQRPPGIYFTYWAGFSIFGWTPAAVAWLDILAAALTALLLWSIVRQLSGGLAAALTAALYSLFTIPSWLYGHGGFLERSVCETFIVVCVAAAAWCAVKFVQEGKQVYPFAIGLCCGAAIVLKPNAGLYLPALVLWTQMHARKAPGASTIRLGILGAAAAGCLILPVLTLAWLWRHDLLYEARVAVIQFNRHYVGQGFSPGSYALDFSRAVFLRLKTDPLWLAGAIGSVIVMWDLARRRLSPAAALALIWGAAAALVIIVNGARLFNSYFIQAFPPLAVLAAWTLTESARVSRLRALLAVSTSVLMLSVLVQRDYAGRVIEWARGDLAVLQGRVDRTTYLERFGGYANKRGYSARAIAELAAYVRAHTTADESVFLFGINGAGIYFEADRLPAHRFLRVNFFVPDDFPNPRFTLETVADELASSRPRYIIFERLNAVSARGAEMAAAVDALPHHPRVLELLDGYRLEATIEDFTLYRRID